MDLKKSLAFAVPVNNAKAADVELKPVFLVHCQKVACSRIVHKSQATKKKVNVYLPSLRMKVPDHIYVFGSLLLQ
jgi:hypothetical protein